MPPHEEFAGTSRFHVLRRIGAGAFGAVYEVFDARRNAKVAVKTLPRAGGEALLGFKREFLALVGLAHPNLVGLHELLNDGDRWFFTMDLVDGVDLVTYVRAGAPPGVGGDESRLRSTLRQLAGATQALHDAGKLHRDLKPSNVLVTPDGQVKVLDFGLVRDISGGIVSSATANIVGTPVYMSPELIVGAAASWAADWYSVGAILYVGLTGREPFFGSTFDILENKLHYEPPPPRAAAAQVPPDLDTLCASLLRRDPADRPTGREILRRLGVGVRTLPRHSATIYGRRKQIAALVNSARAVDNSSRPALVYLRGAPGMGKSAVLRQFTSELATTEPRPLVLAGRCYERESVPYKGLDGVVDALASWLRRTAERRVERVADRDMVVLSKLFPVLAQVCPERGSIEPAMVDLQELRRRAWQSLGNVFEAIAAERPLVVIIDDAHFGDADSGSLLADVLSRPQPPAMLLVLAHSNEAIGDGQFLTILAPERAAEWGLKVMELELGPLAEADATRMALELLGARNSDSRSRAEAIARESHGCPAFVSVLAAYSLIGGSGDDPHPTLAGVVRAHLESLPTTVAVLLSAVSVCGYPLPESIALRVAGLGEADEWAVNTLVANNLARVTTRAGVATLEPYHARVGDAVASLLSPERQQAIHSALADATAALAPAAHERLAWHYYYGKGAELAGVPALAAAREAVAALAFDRGAALLQLAASTLPSAEVHSLRLLSALGDTLVCAGRGADAARAYLDEAGHLEGIERDNLHRLAAEQLLASGHVREGVGLLFGLMEKLDIAIPGTPDQAARSAARSAEALKARGFDYEQKGEYEPVDELRLDVYWSAAKGLSLIDPARGIDFQLRHVLLALDSGDRVRAARALALQCAHASSPGTAARVATAATVAAARALARRVADPAINGLAALSIAVAAYNEGRWIDALDLFAEAEQLLEDCRGVAWEHDTLRHYQLRTLIALGRLAELRRLLPGHLQEVKARKDRFGETNTYTRAAYMAYLAEGEADFARRRLSEAMTGWPADAFLFQHYYAMVAEAEIALFEGQADLAQDIVNRQWSLFEASQLMSIQLIRIQCAELRARCALASKDPSAGIVVQGLSDGLRQEKADWADALALLLAAGVATLGGDRAEAVRLLESAIGGCDAVGMQLHAAGASYRLASLTSGEVAARAAARAEDYFNRERIRFPAKMVNMIAPWE